MPNNLGQLIESQRLKLGLQQKEVAKLIGITNVSLCKVQTGERRLSKEKLKILADVLQVNYSEILQCSGYDIKTEYNCAKSRIIQGDENLILLLDEVIDDYDNIGILKELIAILNKANRKDKANVKRTLHLLKTGLYHSE